jgi:hypothetical protein
MLGHAALGRYALGQMPSPVAVSAVAGAFALTGANAALSAAIRAGVGSFTAAGADAALLYATGTRLTAAAASFSVSGGSATFNVGMPAQAGLFAVTGFAAGLKITFPTSAGSFSAVGAATLKRGLRLYAWPTLAQKTANHVLFAPLGERALGSGVRGPESEITFSLGGQTATFARVRRLVVGSGEFRLTMSAAGLFYSSYPSKLRLFPSVGRGARAVSRGTEPLRVFASTGHGARRRAFGG